ncbi:hypothetical protein I8D64_01755 [Brachybacterium sp. MASK1Z-5]|uniref:Helix-turn-helix domain-containing protein n=1 Tax=Brachybacterium halotolerans TaxID=2795215 RepID=A0ABS1B663_9MICO|nr:hypothetical protein [Brachybacterium halotolerans]MBK0330128.1 hypothetical protein [Brachybacterium halotolerans]
MSEVVFDSQIHHRRMKESGAYRGLRLALLIHENRDDSGHWSPASMASLRRALAGPKEDKCSVVDVEVAIRQLKSQGVLERECEWRHLQLTGGGAE